LKKYNFKIKKNLEKWGNNIICLPTTAEAQRKKIDESSRLSGYPNCRFSLQYTSAQVYTPAIHRQR